MSVHTVQLPKSELSQLKNTVFVDMSGSRYFIVHFIVHFDALHVMAVSAGTCLGLLSL